jgi:Ca-activated chloride channel family protein
MRFLYPDAASWLLMAPFAVAVWYLHAVAKRRFRRQAAIDRHLPPLSRLSTWRRDATALLASVLAIGFLVAAMCRPQILLTQRVPEYAKEDLILVLDRSVSMRAEDVAPSRFARAVAEIKAFLARKPDSLDRVALVGFAGTSLVLSPLTRDMNNLFFYLDWIEEDPEPRFGTDIGNALANAREIARRDRHGSRKIFLVLSDGDDQSPALEKQLAELRAEQARVYTIGIGSERETAIPLRTEDRTVTFLEDEKGQPVMTRFNEGTLRRIALMTDGRYIRSVTGSEVAPALRQAVQREREIVAWKTSTEYRDLYRECLMAAGFAALILLLAI